MMLTILEKYFLEHGQLVLPGIGHLRMNQIDAVQLNGQFQPPIHQIVFDAIIEPTTKPNKLFYIYLFIQKYIFAGLWELFPQPTLQIIDILLQILFQEIEIGHL